MTRIYFVNWNALPKSVGGCETVFASLQKELGGEHVVYPFGASTPPGAPKMMFIEEYKSWYFDSVLAETASESDIIIANCGIVNVWKKQKAKVINIYSDAYIRSQIEIIKTNYPESYNPLGILRLSEMQIRSAKGAFNVAVSMAAKKAMEELGIKCHAVIEHGVNPKFFRQVPKDKARKELGLDNGPVGMFIGLMQPVKNWRIVEALMKERDDIEWLIVLKQLVPSSRRFYMNNAHVFVAVDFSSMPLLYSAADFVVIPSVFETFGLVSVEAGLCNVPCVTNKVGWVNETGTTPYGYVVKRPVLEEYLKGIDVVLQNQFKPREYMTERFNYAEWVRKWKNLIESVKLK